MSVKLPSLRHYREQAALTQTELAHAAEVSRVTVSFLEVGARSATPRTARQLARALHCKPADLMQQPEVQS